jgi:hypothetical protein
MTTGPHFHDGSAAFWSALRNFRGNYPDGIVLPDHKCRHGEFKE